MSCDGRSHFYAICGYLIMGGDVERTVPMGMLAVLLLIAGVVGAQEVNKLDEWTMVRRGRMDSGGEYRAMHLATSDYTIQPIYDAEMEYIERFPEENPPTDEVDKWLDDYPVVASLSVSVGTGDSSGDSFVSLSMTFDHWLEEETRFGVESGPESIRVRFGDGPWFTAEGFGVNGDDEVIQSSWFYVSDDATARSVAEEMGRRDTLTVEVSGAGGVPRHHRFDLRHVHEWIADTRQWAIESLGR